MEFVKEISVREAILLCIENGIKGAESQLKSFDNAKPNRLSSKNQINALKGNLECVYKNVKITGGGKRGKVFLGGLKDKVTKKEDRRVDNTGQPTSEEQIIMNQYIFDHLKKMYSKGNYMEYSITGWSKQIGLLDTEDIPARRFERRISDVHANTQFYRIKPSEVVRIFQTDTIYNRNNQVVESALNRLNKNGEIELIKHYNLVQHNEKKRRIEKREYEEIGTARRELLEELGSSIGAYNYAIGNPSPSHKMKDILTSVSKMLAEKFDCKFIYESFEVISIKEQVDYSVTKDDFMEVYWTRLITLTASRQKRYDNEPKEEQTWFWKKFYAYNTFVLMEYMGIDTGGLLLEYEIGKTERAKELLDAYETWEKKDKPLGFGYALERIECELLHFEC